MTLSTLVHARRWPFWPGEEWLSKPRTQRLGQDNRTPAPEDMPRALGIGLSSWPGSLLPSFSPCLWAPPSPASNLRSPDSQHGSLHEGLGPRAAFLLPAEVREPRPPHDLKLNPWRLPRQEWGRGAGPEPGLSSQTALDANSAPLSPSCALWNQAP